MDITIITNDVRISRECADELWKYDYSYGDDIWDCEEDVWGDCEEMASFGLLNFKRNNMDFLRENENYIKILLKHKVEGDITFCAYDESYFCAGWGFRFDGKGGYNKLVGKVTITFGEV